MSDSYAKLNHFCLIILAFTAITVGLGYMKTALIPFVLSVFVYAISSPIIDFLRHKLKIRRWIAVLTTLILFLLISALLISFLVSSIGTFISAADFYIDRFYQFLGSVVKIAAEFGVPIDRAQVEQYVTKLPIFDWAGNITGSIFSAIGTSTLVSIFVLFLIAGSGSGEVTNPIVQEVFSSVSRYLGTKLFTSLLTGFIVWGILSIAGADLAFLFGFVTVLLNFIPSIGSIIATIIPLPIVLLQFQFGATFLIVAISISITQFVIGNILEPKIMGHRLDLHPVAILIFLIFWGIVWGVPGAFLAVPITAVLKIIFARIETTRPLSELLAGRIPNI